MKNKPKKYINAGIASAMAIGSVVAVAPLTTEASVKFPDIKETDHYYNAVISLVERGIIKGYEDGTFKPSHSVTRGQAAKIIAGVLKLDTTNVVNPGFKDVPTTNEYYGAIAALANAGIINGYPDGTFGPGKPVKRNHMAKIIAGAFDIQAPVGSTTPFKDLNAEYSGYITALYVAGITTGKTETTFDGAANVTRGQMASFVVRAEKATTPNDKIEEVTLTIDSVTNNMIGKYKVSDAAKPILNEKNNEALADALVSVNVRNKEILSVNSIQLNTSGTAENTITLDGANAEIEGNLTINADYVEVKNLTVKGDVSITKNVVNAFTADGLVSQGQLIVEEGSDAVASLVPVFAKDKKGPKVSLKNSDVKNVNVKRDGITLESDTKLVDVQISAKVSSIELNANAGKVTVDVTVSVEITGQGAIDEVQLVKAIEVALKTVGSIGKLDISDSGAKVEISATLTINKVEIVKGTDIKDVIQNYDEIKENIKEIIVSKPSIDNSPGNESTVTKGAFSIGETSYNTLQEAVNAAKSKDIIKLSQDYTGAGIFLAENAQKDITIDFGGHTYTVNEAVGSPRFETQAMHLEKGNTVTLQNGTITSNGEGNVKMLVQNYSDLTLEDMNLDGTQLIDAGKGRYVLSNNSGTVNINGNTSITAKEGDIALDSHKFKGYENAIPTVNVNTAGTIKGKLEVTGGKVNIEGGTFDGELTTGANYEQGDFVIKGGTFTVDPSAYTHTDSTVEKSGENQAIWKVIAPVVTSQTLDLGYHFVLENGVIRFLG